MKNFLKLSTSLTAVFLGSFLLAQAATVFYSNQTGATPVSGYYLKTDGTNSTWAAVSASGSGTISTSSPLTSGQPLYATGWNTLASIASSTFLTSLGGITLGSLSGTYPIIYNNGAISTAMSSSTLTASSPLTGSFAQVGTGGTLGCTTASSGVAGCLSNTAFDTFNGKQNALGTLTGIIMGNAGSFYGTATSSPIQMSITGNAGTVTNGVYTTGAGTVYQAPISLTTTGTSGAATFSANTLNIPQYAGTTYTASTGLTLTGTAFSVNTSQNISTLSNLTTAGLVQTTASGVLSSALLTGGQVTTALGFTPYSATNPSSYIALTALSGTAPITYNSSTGAIGITQAATGANGYLSSTDWNTFNGKQAAITGTTGQFPYFSGTNTLTATSSLFLAANGNFGIGTTTPSAKLTVWGSDTGATNLANFVNSASTSVMTILNNGNVGIGTTGPLSKLDVLVADAGAIGTDVRTRGIVSEYYGIGAYGGKGGISIVAGGTRAAPTAVSVNDIAGLAQPIFYDGTVWRVGSRIESAVAAVTNNTSVATELRFFTGTVTGNATAGGFTGSTQQMVIDKSGNVGIGDTAPGTKLSVVGNAAIGYASGQTAPANGLVIQGNVGIGTTTPNSLLQLFSTGTTTMSIDSNSATKGGCIEIKNRSGIGYTYIYAEAGVLYSDTISCR